jgi:serine/threonine protein kinase
MKELSLINCRLDRRYDIYEQLGRGSYAEIYLACDTLASPQSSHSKVVIKALNVFLQDDLDADLERTLVENFQNEAIALDRVRHPNIISRLGHGTARDLRGTVFHYLVLEYLAGGDLQTLVRRRPLSPKRGLDYIEQVCAGLGHAHTRGIIHRDIKPQNLLLTADLVTVKIADFGVARVEISDSPITRVGTNIYAPPEHSPMSIGRTGSLDYGGLTPAADIYSLAKSTYSLICGESPRAYAHEQISGLSGSMAGKEFSEELLRILKKATANDPRERHQTVKEFWSELAEVRRIAEDGEFSTVIRPEPAIPQPHVSRGYSPIAPVQPEFQALDEAESPVAVRPSAELRLPDYARRNGTEAAVEPPNGNQPVFQPPTPVTVKSSNLVVVPPIRKRRRLRRFITFMVFLGIFTGVLYGTASYMRGRGILPDIRYLFRTQTGIANTDIYLRPAPNTDSDPIGLVTKNSKVRIVNSQNNWYQVDVIEQGRSRPNAPNVTRGWLNGKYVDISDN